MKKEEFIINNVELIIALTPHRSAVAPIRLDPVRSFPTAAAPVHSDAPARVSPSPADASPAPASCSFWRGSPFRAAAAHTPAPVSRARHALCPNARARVFSGARAPCVQPLCAPVLVLCDEHKQAELNTNINVCQRKILRGINFRCVRFAKSKTLFDI